jgi:hypothetical protein
MLSPIFESEPSMPGRRWRIVDMSLVTADYPMRMGEYVQYAVLRSPGADTMLEKWLKHPSSKPILQEVFGAVRPPEWRPAFPATPSTPPDQTVLEVLKRAVQEERLILLRPRKRDASSAGDPQILAEQIAEAARARAAAASAAKSGSSQNSSSTNKKTWVEFELLDQKGRPVPRARYRLKVTDGSVREGSLDENGRVRVTGLDPGTCDISFLDFDGREWHRS